MSEACSRRWFHYSLRTLFVAVTIVGLVLGWLAWNRQIVLARQQALVQLARDGGEILNVNQLLRERDYIGGRLGRRESQRMQIRSDEIRRRCHIQTVRQWLGDQPVGAIELPWFYNEADQARIEAAFPEAQIRPFRPEFH